MAHQQFQSCIDACQACATACDHCATACLAEPDVQAMARCIALDMDCADICRLAAACMARGSEAANAVCDTCAHLCDLCGEECAKHKHDHCQECAAACRRCAEECRRMAGSGRTTARSSGKGATAHH
ncbi:MAG TPA: four-helix bundle copper-binding protein [Rhodocyclaceae bacterium]|nr:four-helix bundle copper-binding protein [Rhodocyclaceae bacterium]